MDQAGSGDEFLELGHKWHLGTVHDVTFSQLPGLFWRGGGWGIGVQWPKMALKCTICDPRSQRISGRGPSDPPERGWLICGSLNKHMHTPPSLALRTFRLFGRSPFWSLTPFLSVIYIYFLAFRSSVRSLVHVCSIKTVRPRGSMRGVRLHIYYIDFSQ